MLLQFGEASGLPLYGVRGTGAQLPGPPRGPAEEGQPALEVG